MNKPRLSFWQIWNMSFGFLGIQFGWGLQLANMSGIYTYLGAHISNWSAVMATAMLASIPAIILLVIAQKYIAAGATGGAVK